MNSLCPVIELFSAVYTLALWSKSGSLKEGKIKIMISKFVFFQLALQFVIINFFFRRVILFNDTFWIVESYWLNLTKTREGERNYGNIVNRYSLVSSIKDEVEEWSFQVKVFISNISFLEVFNSQSNSAQKVLFPTSF